MLIPAPLRCGGDGTGARSWPAPVQLLGRARVGVAGGNEDPVGVVGGEGEDADPGRGQRRQQRGEDAGQREVERSVDLEGGERLLVPDLVGTLRARADHRGLGRRSRSPRRVEEDSAQDPAHVGAGRTGEHRQRLGVSGRSVHGATPTCSGRGPRPGRARGSCTAPRRRRCPWPGCRPRRPRPAGRRRSSTVTWRCTALEPMHRLGLRPLALRRAGARTARRRTPSS